ncbi:MAG: phage/plasmid primase, P4 family [Massilia sp.]
MNTKQKFVSTVLKPVRLEMLKFYRFFHDGHEASFLCFRKDATIRPVKPRPYFGKLTKVIDKKLVTANDDGMEISMLIARTDGPGRAAQHVIEIVAVFADFDGGEWNLDQLRNLLIEPHLIVKTSPGNYHAYWKVSGCSVQQFKSVQTALAKSLDSDANVCDTSRVMRMAGTINWKREQPFLTTIVHIVDEPLTIDIDAFIEGMNLWIGATPAASGMGCEMQIQQDSVQRKLSPRRKAEVEAALKSLSSDDRSLWQRVGMAIHSADNTAAGYDIWKEWSSSSSKFDESEQRKRWEAFKANAGVNIDTLFWLAKHAGQVPSCVFDEMSIARCFVSTFVERLRYDYRAKIWYCFGGVVWAVDAQAPIRAVRSFVEEMTGGEKGAVSDSLNRFRTTAGFRAIVSHVELLDEIHITEDTFDTDPYLLAVENGVIDLRTGGFRTARASDYLRRQAKVAYDCDAKPPEWIRFMKSVTCVDRELYEFIRRALGYALFGHANLQLFFMAVGSGANGKGVLMRTVQRILGDYAQSVPPNLLTTAYGGNVNSPSPALARLQGSRFVVCTELPTGKRMDDAFIKQYAGGDEISARAAYGDVISFKPEGKLWLSTNEVPHIDASDSAMWRRLKPIPFNASFIGDDADPRLEEKLAEEGAGVLNWLLRGARSFLESGLGSCAKVDNLEAEMRKDADSVLAWLNEACSKNATAKIASSAAYESYISFTRRAGHKPLNQPVFLASLKKKGYEHRKTKTGNIFIGFRLNRKINLR